MSSIAIVGGSGFDTFDSLVVDNVIVQETPYGAHSEPLIKGRLKRQECLFLARHGANHALPPHRVNYRANMWLLHSLGVKKIIAFNVVGGITENMSPDTLVIPDQIIDYTHNRQHTYFDGDQNQGLDEKFQNVEHIDFTYPFSKRLRQDVMHFFKQSHIEFVQQGVYGCTQGPRLESAAEIQRLKRDGCDIVGMTAMPEAALAAELKMDYVTISIVVNWAAGVSQESLSMVDIMNTVRKNMRKIKSQLPDLLQFL